MTPSRPTTFAPSRRAVLLAGAAGLIAAAGLEPAGGTSAEAAARGTSADAAAGGTTRSGRGPSAGVAATPSSATPDHRLVARRSAVVGHHRHRVIRSLDDVGTTQQHGSHAGSRPAFARRAIMLTLDDGPHPVWTPRMLDLLERHGITATFFMIGAQARRHPGVVREVAARGHVIGNHTWTHDEFLTQRPVSRIRSEVERTSHAIHAACGVTPTQFRAPGGTWGPALLDVLAEHDLLPVGWDVDPADWSRPGTRSIEKTLLHMRPHDVALCHDGGGDRSQTFRALRYVIPRLQRRGDTFVTLRGVSVSG